MLKSQFAMGSIYSYTKLLPKGPAAEKYYVYKWITLGTACYVDMLKMFFRLNIFWNPGPLVESHAKFYSYMYVL